jgi:hypothetical protein
MDWLSGNEGIPQTGDQKEIAALRRKIKMMHQQVDKYKWPPPLSLNESPKIDAPTVVAAGLLCLDDKNAPNSRQ